MPSPKALEEASRISVLACKAGRPAPAMVPMSNGGVQLEWHYDGWDIELYVEPDGETSIWYGGVKGDELMRTLPVDSDPRILERLDMAYCADCDLRMYRGTRHPHPLTPVQVTVTEVSGA